MQAFISPEMGPLREVTGDGSVISISTLWVLGELTLQNTSQPHPKNSSQPFEARLQNLLNLHLVPNFPFSTIGTLKTILHLSDI